MRDSLSIFKQDSSFYLEKHTVSRTIEYKHRGEKPQGNTVNGVVATSQTF